MRKPAKRGKLRILGHFPRIAATESSHSWVGVCPACSSVVLTLDKHLILSGLPLHSDRLARRELPSTISSPPLYWVPKLLRSMHDRPGHRTAPSSAACPLPQRRPRPSSMDQFSGTKHRCPRSLSYPAASIACLARWIMAVLCCDFVEHDLATRAIFREAVLEHAARACVKDASPPDSTVNHPLRLGGCCDELPHRCDLVLFCPQIWRAVAVPSLSLSWLRSSLMYSAALFVECSAYGLQGKTLTSSAALAWNC